MLKLATVDAQISRVQAGVTGRIMLNDTQLEIIEIMVENPSGALACPTHAHTWYEFNYVIEGKMATSFRGGPLLEVGPGHFFLIPPGMEHAHSYDAIRPHRGICIRWIIESIDNATIHDKLAPHDSTYQQLQSLKLLQPGCYKDQYGIGGMLQRFFESAEQNQSPLMLKLFIVTFLLVLTTITEPPDVRQPLAADQSDAALLRKIEIYLNDDQSQKVNVHQLAASLHMSYGNLARRYKQLTKQTIIDRMTSIRLERSLLLLVQTEKPIQEIADIAGFTNPYYFSRIFKGYYGVSPREYRKMHVDHG